MTDISQHKAQLREALRKARLDHARALPPEVSALVFRQPPAPVLALVPEGAVIGLYRAGEGEAPAAAYTRFFHERGHTVALPRVVKRAEPMHFHVHTDPWDESDLEPGPMNLRQPRLSAPLVVPDVLFMPLVGFTERGERIGQGGGFYDRWLADHPETVAIGMGWDVQRVDELPVEDHDMPLTAIVTPTRIYGPFA
ncbi:5-formyltetrahydrofolate cyclo-ligase [Aurantiacibacter luteus]|uniref:5-formyltetrahydrofolate cyclo-ligase n=1 Tax=Aurantiacibacter luteus TaxID=1581420 RepID=A0A0G9MYQ4_9SPHN|nr:5-formyltetrahydrofolate cyclo-ligase [Aurantiacibacter luteus]KLE35669.1 5-formyltetrahydrofolate cyclo-ligase [Aurantiacibacter luteus]